MVRTTNGLIMVFVCIVALWLFRSATSACDPRNLALVHTESSATAFVRADSNGDGQLSQTEFAVAAAELQAGLIATSRAQSLLGGEPPADHTGTNVTMRAATERHTAELSPAAGALVAPASAGPVSPAAPLPQCSILVFWHVVKTAGTTVRTVLQRQAQLGEFEYVYSDTVTKPRWQLIMHQLSQRVAPRRIIIELHSEWGLPTSFFADITQLRSLYAPIGCRVTLATVLRHPVAWYLSMFNWRASNTIPLCQWQPPRDGLSRQITGYSLPFTRPGPRDRDRWTSPALSVSILKHFDVVGLTEMLDESLLLLAAKAGLRHLGYSTLAANNKPDHPSKAKALLKALLAQISASITEPFTPLPPAESAERAAAAAGARAIASGAALDWGNAEWEAHGRREALSEWGDAALEAMGALSEVSMAYVERRRDAKADCNFYPCEPGLEAHKGLWSRQLCPTREGGLGSPRHLLLKMLDRTAADRAVHAYVVRRLRTQLAESGGGAGRIEERLKQLKRDSATMAARRTEAVGPNNRKLCGVHLCDTNARRSCVSCPADPVPALESCWPSWEDQFSPDEQKWWCKRSWTVAGYDAAEMKARNYPQVEPPAFPQVPCWQTCWEGMQPDADTCLKRDAPPPDTGRPGLGCKTKLYCSPTCPTSRFASLPKFWDQWAADRAMLLGGKSFPKLNVTGGPTGFGG